MNNVTPSFFHQDAVRGGQVFGLKMYQLRTTSDVASQRDSTDCPVYLFRVTGVFLGGLELETSD